MRINRTTMEESLHMLMGEDYSECSGRTEKDGYLAFYQERGLYSVEYEDSGIVSLVYAKNPHEAIELVDGFRKMRTEKELNELQAYREHMELQYLDDMDNPLEPLKLSNALQSEIFKYEYRKEHKPEDINILDYTVMYALKHCLEEQLKEGGGTDD